MMIIRLCAALRFAALPCAALSFAVLPLVAMMDAGQAATPVALEGQKGMVVTSHHLASEIGAGILKGGGNAIDAAVAVGYAEAVVNPCCGNIGGGGFIVLHLADCRDRVLNFRET